MRPRSAQKKSTTTFLNGVHKLSTNVVQKVNKGWLKFERKVYTKLKKCV